MLPEAFDQKIDENRESALYLDANICLDIVSFFDSKGISDKALINIQTLILFCQQNKMEVVSNLEPWSSVIIETLKRWI